MKHIQTWACLGHTAEGRGPMRVVCHADSQVVASQIISLKEYYGQWGVMGYPIGDFGIRKEDLFIFSTVQDYLDNRESELIRQKALSKLTQKEREVLGL